MTDRPSRNVHRPSTRRTTHRSAVLPKEAIARALARLDAIAPDGPAAAIVLGLAARGHRRRTLAGLAVADVVRTGSAILDNVPRPRIGLTINARRCASLVTDPFWFDGAAGAWIARRARGACGRTELFPEAAFPAALAAISEVLGEKVGWYTLRSHAAAKLVPHLGTSAVSTVIAKHYAAWQTGGR